MSFIFDINTIDGSGSYQGDLASSYTNALSAYIQNEEGADIAAFLSHTVYGLTVEQALALKAALIDGNFQLSGLFGAAQSKEGVVDGDNITDPEPTLTVGSIVINLSAMLDGLDTATWETLVKKATIYHTREFYTESQVPDGYAVGWDSENLAPTADPITWDVTEYDEHAAANPNPANETVDLLSTATDLDNDTLLVVDGSVTLADGTPLPNYLTVSGNTLTIDTNSAYFDSLYKDVPLDLDLVYQITDGTATIDNTVALTITGTADQFHYTLDPFATNKVLGTSDGNDPDVPGVDDGSITLELTGVDAGAFDFTGTVNVSVTGDINKINGETYDQELVLVTAEGGGFDYLGPVAYIYTGNEPKGFNEEKPESYTTDTAELNFASADNQVLVTYDATNEVKDFDVTATISQFDYWL